MRRLLCLLLVAAGAAGADPVFEHPATAAELQRLLGPVTQRLAAAAAVRGEFQQRKFLHELSQPLVSSGEFLVARGLGVDWHTRRPFDSELVLNAQAMVERGAGGEVQRVDAASQPGLGAVAQVFDALFTLDLAKLAEQFTLYSAGRTEAWTLGLKPREAALAQTIESVTVSGAGQPGQIVLREAGGDRTEISFSRQRLQAELSAAERKSLAP